MTIISNNLARIKNDRRVGEYEEGVYMMKYNEIAIKKLM